MNIILTYNQECNFYLFIQMELRLYTNTRNPHNLESGHLSLSVSKLNLNKLFLT